MDTKDSSHIVMKIPVVGACGVGKTTLIKRISSFYYYLEEGATPDSINKQYPACSKHYSFTGFIIKIQYWDCPSDEKYYRLLPQFTSDAAGIIFIYDYNKRRSFEEIKKLFNIISLNRHPFNFLIANNVTTSFSNTREVSREEGMKLSSELDMLYKETEFTNEIFNDLLVKYFFPQIPLHPLNSVFLLQNNIHTTNKLINEYDEIERQLEEEYD